MVGEGGNAEKRGETRSQSASLKDNDKDPFVYSRYASLETQEILSMFNTSLHGLTDKEVTKRVSLYGYNEPAKKEKIPVVKQILMKFLNPLIILLLIIVLSSLFFGEMVSAIFVSLMIIISVFLGYIQEYRSELAVEKLNRLIKTNVSVFRESKSKEVDIKELVPGDIVDLYAGDMIPADLRIISSKDLFINQSSLTGESFPVEKVHDPIVPKGNSMQELNNIAFMGSSVVSGTGLGVVVRTGISTQFGEISKKLSETEVDTSFDKGIKKFTMLMIKFIIVLVIGIFLIISVVKQGSLREALLFSLAVAVGLTPEMLPMIVTINLSKGASDMAKKKVIVKQLDSIQNFGAMDILCTDKTGTLTMDSIVLEKHCDVAGKEDETVLKYAYINSLNQTGLKNVLDRAILKHEKFSLKNYKKVDEIPFDFSRKIMSVVVEEKGKHLLVAKGAPEEMFERCDRYALKGKVRKIHGKIFAKVKKEYDLLSGQGFRVLAVAYKDIKTKKKAYSKNDEKGLVLLGYIAFLDPPKPTTKKSLEELKHRGIEVKILTGDNELVTKKICDEVSLEVKGILTGDKLDGLTDKELQTVVEVTTIFARLSPLQKERIIRILHQNNHTVGYLGDGINDAPSLKSSDVGISVNNGVDIAKESADIILLEKDLTVLQDGVVEGRKVFGNIVKYIKMGASSNFGNMLAMAGATLFLPFLPMLPIQILLNNFLYDLSQFSLPTDKVDKEYLAKPKPWNVNFIKRFMLYIGPISSIFDFVTFGVMLYIFNAQPALFQTGWFIESLCTQTLIIYIIRTNKLPFIESKPSNYLLVTSLLILAIGFAIPFTPLAVFFGFTPLPALYFLILAGIIVCYVVLVQLMKSWMIKKYGVD
jgi:P-type Mg2+ transporter